MNELGFEITVNLLPEIVDVDINEVGSGIEMGIPYILGNFHTADYPFGVLGHVYQQVIFLGRQAYRSLSAEYLMLSEIDPQVGVSQLLGFRSSLFRISFEQDLMRAFSSRKSKGLTM